MSVSTVTTSLVFATNNSLNEYEQIVADFNKEYGTEYQIAKPEQLNRAGESIEKITNLFNGMN